MPYLPRVVDAELRSRLGAAGAVLIEGPKACGKTETALQQSSSQVRLDVDPDARRVAELDPTLVLAGAVPRLLDEWQVVPALWNHVRRAVDDRQRDGQFILTGSAVPADDTTRHSGAGRVSRLRMRPMTLFETGHTNGQASLASVLAGEPIRAAEPGLTLTDLVDRICVGGWPGGLGRSVATAQRGVRDYLDEVRRTDIRTLDGVRRDPAKVGRVMAALARHVSTQASDSTVATDAGGSDGPVDRATVRDYLAALARLMVVEDQPAWAPHLRSRSVLRSSATRHFVDPSLAVGALGANPERLLRDLNLLGLLFESLVVRDLRVHAQANDAQVLHYRDNTGLEVDAIVEDHSGRWAAIEVKLGQGAVDGAAASLLRFSRRVDTARCGEPAALVVITGTGYGYVRDDGVTVVPIGALRP